MKEKKYRFQSARETAEKMQSGFSSSTINMPEGMSSFRLTSAGTKKLDIIPFVTGDGNPFCDADMAYWERTYYAHRGVGPNEEMVVCRSRTANEPCPVCEYRAKLAKDPDADPKLVEGLNPKRRQLFCVIDPSEPEKGVQIWDISYHLFGKLLAERLAEAEEDSGWENFYHPVKGKRLRLTVREETMGSNKFFTVSAIDFIDRKPYEMDIIEKAPCLDEILKLKSYDELKALLYQTPRGDDSDEDVEEAPKAKKASKAVEDDDDDIDMSPPKSQKKASKADEDEDDDDSDDEDEKPAPKKKVVEEDDDSDDEDSDDEDSDDDTPAKKPSKKTKPAAEDDEDDSDESDDDDKPAKKIKKPAADEDDDADLDDDDEEPAPKKAKKSAEDDDSDDDSDSDDDDDDDSDDTPAEKPAKKKAEEDEDEEDDWDDELPKKKTKK